MNAFHHDRSIAIKTALSAFLDPQQTTKAVELWREKYATQATFSVQYFVRECCALFGVESLRNQLVQSLVLELNSQRMNPGTERSVREKNNSVSPQNEIAVQTFQLLFRALTESAGPLRGKEISRYVVDSLPKMALPKDAKRSLEMWLNRDMPVIEVAVPIPLLTELVNRAYIGLCEYCGPVKADHILHDCVSRVASTAAGQLFHPQQLL
jgi:hypothetical protein